MSNYVDLNYDISSFDNSKSPPPPPKSPSILLRFLDN